MKNPKMHNDVYELRKEWMTIDDLIEFLKKNGFPDSLNAQTIKRWEKDGLIPQPKRITIKTKPWRVYSKDGTDFFYILERLEDHTFKRIVKDMKRK